MDVIHYASKTGNDPFQEWLNDLADLQARAAILRRVDRLSLGNFGDCKFCRDGVWELRIDVGPGYRVYYAQSGRTIVLLLCGGSKRTQVKDINAAVAYWTDYRRRTLS